MGSSRAPSRSPSPRQTPFKSENGVGEKEMQLITGKPTKEVKERVKYSDSDSVEESKASKPNKLEIYCIIDGESTSFPVVVSSKITVGLFKQAIYPNVTVGTEVKSRDLRLWRAVDPKRDNNNNIDFDGTEDITELDDERALLSELDELTDRRTFVIVRLPKRGLDPKRKLESDTHDDSASKKTRTEGQWEIFKAMDKKSVELPSAWVKILKGNGPQPAPCNEFADLKGDLQAGQRIVIPSMGEVPKDFEKYSSDPHLFITEQMLRLWNEIKKPQRNAYRRVLSGPMGVGKSFLSYFLAARAYAEGWIILYIPDAEVLNKETRKESESEVVKRFLALNKDILSSTDLSMLASAHCEPGGELMTVIFEKFLMQPSNECKAITIVDEHRALFRKKHSIPEKYISLAYLDKLSRWRDDYAGSRLIFAGTQHAKFELKYMEDSFKSDRHTVEFVGPLSKDIFLKLLDAGIETDADIESSIHLSPKEIEKIVEITNCVPRELMYLCDILKESLNLSTDAAFLRYETERMREFETKADQYLEEILNDPISYSNFYRGLSQAFLYGSVKESFKLKFIDLGLLYRLRRDGETLFRPLCPAAKKALLEVFKKMDMPTNLKKRLHTGNLDGKDFEMVFFHAIICANKPVMLKSTDLNGRNENVIELDFKDYGVISRAEVHFLGQTKDTHLSHGYENYPRFDFMIGPIFIQVSVSEFGAHNKESQDFRKAFQRPYKDIFGGVHRKNQIECCLDHMYGGNHTAKINTRGRFIVTRRDPSNRDIPVEGFRVVYICGRDIELKNHPGLVRELADVAHVSFNELKDSLFANIH
ncbi:hypothetical protein BGZ76_009497 [Entomortierella beljakovae]|nr:hypothetical protein BGZ76_009497 [Entomortierella beljakovae]